MKLADALSVTKGDVIAFIGAGGKTSALFRLGAELRNRGFRVLAATTTRIGVDELIHAPASIAISPQLREDAQVSRALSSSGFVFVYDSIRDAKVQGISLETASLLMDRVSSDVLLIEADGARRMSLKVPYLHEPVVPPDVTKIVLVAGMDILGQPLDEAHVYNAAAIMRRYGYPEGAAIVWPWLASVLRDEALGLANLPPHAPVHVLLNKAPEQGALRRQAWLIATLLLRSPRIHAVMLGAMMNPVDPIYEVRTPVSAVILAAGLSSRMGKMKVLLPWGAGTVLDAIIQQLYMARVDHIVVVTGRDADRVARVAGRYNVEVVHNPDFVQGEMLSSVQVALRGLPARVDGALIVLGDQPQMRGYVVARVLDAFAQTRSPIVIPSFQRRRGHPVLFGRSIWPELLALPAGGMPRAVVNAHADQIAYVNVNTETILQDIDTYDEYRAALRDAGLS